MSTTISTYSTYGSGRIYQPNEYVAKESYLDVRNELRESYMTWIIILSLLFFAVGAMLLINTTVFADTRATGSSVISRQVGHSLFWANLIFTLLTFTALFISIFLIFAIRQPSTI